MGSMPHWFAKTKEMAAFDRYFSVTDVDEKGLLDRYVQALGRMSTAQYFGRSDALDGRDDARAYQAVSERNHRGRRARPGGSSR